MEKLGPPRDGAVRGIDEKMRAALKSLSPKSAENVMRVENPEIGQVLGDAYGAVHGQILKLRGILGG